MLSQSHARPRTARASTAAVVSLSTLTVVAAALRLYGIGHQGLWFDEAYTVMLVKLPLGRMLSTVAKTESTPYLYYLLAWVWTHIFGRGAADLRALSALLGTVAVPVASLAAWRLLESRRAGIVVAALTAFNPLLVWYSQEARAYELLVLLAACSLLAFSFARERATLARLVAWAIACALALATHYDAALVVVPEAVWLLAVHGRRAGAWVACAFVTACGGGLLPLLIAQSNHTSWIRRASLNDRLGQILPQFVLGTGSHAYAVLMWIAFALALAGLVLLALRAEQHQRLRALRVGGIALAGFALVMIVDAAGTDTVLTRNLLALWLPVAIVIAAGLGAVRAAWLGPAITAALCAIGLIATVSVATDRALQRPDWAAVARSLGPWPAGDHAGANRLLVFQRNVWLESLTQVYMPRTHKLGHHSPTGVKEIDIVANTSPPGANRHWLCWWGAGCNLYPSTLQARYSLPGFHALARTRVAQFTIVRLVSAGPRQLTRQELHHAITAAGFFGLLLQRP